MRLEPCPNTCLQTRAICGTKLLPFILFILFLPKDVQIHTCDVSPCRGGESGQLKKFGSRKILDDFHGSRSLVFSAVVYVSESRFFDEADSKSRFLTSRSVSEY